MKRFEIIWYSIIPNKYSHRIRAVIYQWQGTFYSLFLVRIIWLFRCRAILWSIALLAKQTKTLHLSMPSNNIYTCEMIYRWNLNNEWIYSDLSTLMTFHSYPEVMYTHNILWSSYVHTQNILHEHIYVKSNFEGFEIGHDFQINFCGASNLHRKVIMILLCVT